MKILVFAKPGAKRTSVKKMEDLVPGFDASFSVAVKEPAEAGRANCAIEKALAEHFDVPISSIRIVAGHTTHRKVIVIS